MNCAYCDLPVLGPTKLYGSLMLHPKCYEDMNLELDSLYPQENTKNAAEHVCCKAKCGKGQ